MPILAKLVYHGINVLNALILAWALSSWFDPYRRNPLVRALDAIVRPVLRPIDALVPPVGGFGFSPMIAMLLLLLVQRLLLRVL